MCQYLEKINLRWEMLLLPKFDLFQPTFIFLGEHFPIGAKNKNSVHHTKLPNFEELFLRNCHILLFKKVTKT